jgi:hypothetical protein
MIYDEYRSDYYPGEAVTVHVITGERLTGVVRDKTRFGSKLLPDGNFSAPFSRYFVSLDNRPDEEAVVDDAHISRDRKIFTKQVLRSFIKKTVTREAWTGAPWLVKQDLAELYHIDTRIPARLLYDVKVNERKQTQQQKKAGSDYEGMVGSFQGSTQPRLPALKPAPKSHKSKQTQGQQGKGKHQTILNAAPTHPNQQMIYPPAPYTSHTFQASGPPPPVGPHYANFHNSTFAFAPAHSMPTPPPPPPIKYPIEDLQVAPRTDGPKRPAIKFFSQDTPSGDKRRGEGNGILMKSVGPLLESWDTLNVYCEIFKLDSFTFDDFVEALQFSSEDADCELFVEMHCAALKLIVQPLAEGGEIQVRLPEMDEDSEEESDEEESAAPTPTPEPEPVRTRATRRSMAKAEAEAAAEELAREAAAEPKITHRAAEMQAGVDWVEKLAKRDFKNGGWQFIVVGLLNQLSKNPRQFEACEAVLKELAPLDMEPTQATARQQYAQLDVNLRIQALQIICMLTAETKAIRAYMEECSNQMTDFRKEKIQWQRDRKTL